MTRPVYRVAVDAIVMAKQCQQRRSASDERRYPYGTRTTAILRQRRYLARKAPRNREGLQTHASRLRLHPKSYAAN